MINLAKHIRWNGPLQKHLPTPSPSATSGWSSSSSSSSTALKDALDFQQQIKIYYQSMHDEIWKTIEQDFGEILSNNAGSSASLKKMRLNKID